MLLFFLEHFALLDALDFSLLNLVDNHEGALAAGLLTHALALLSNLESLESFNLHKQVELSLLFDPLGLKLFVFLELLVADRYYF